MATSATAVIPAKSIKVFGKSIQCLSKVGHELYIQFTESGMDLRTVNSSRSAYSRMEFKSSFFASFSLNNGQGASCNDDLKCKIQMKPCLNIFKISSIDKNVNSCTIVLALNKNRLKFLLDCKHEIRKSFDLTLQDCESLQAVFKEDDCPNVIVSQPKVITNTICNFHTSQEEITISATKNGITIKNHIEDRADLSKILYTEMNLGAHEFLTYDIKTESSITFCLKELRAIVNFGEYSGHPIAMYFESAGKPIIFNITNKHTFTAEFVLASLVDYDSTSANDSESAHKASTAALEESRYQIVDESFTEYSHIHMDAIAVSKNPLSDFVREHGNGKEDADSDEDECSVIPGTPPKKKTKSTIFDRRFDSGIHSADQASDVLVMDTDSEDDGM